ncbi:hypothetical protein EBI01_01765 [Marinomonas rhizomae]|uniref:Avidin family protein n=1 Tax=Marinomonas rhizomae TaxID=491948 RepID=A0A366JIZ8_9GAMM|nr:avidin/streptavidin family protein [Marinomonas rhizomae]RBP85798.1 avidin family protein [Marinomonas rhizomae]RNF75585.1 hypothetical protein EBI01_01765 [Marinomonas rhizomae]
MSQNLNGSWVNSYGSKMDLLVVEGGAIVGQYSSTTGSTGIYSVIGQCSPKTPQEGKGLAVVLSIYWHPINAETPDESWHWVSTYCGQLLGAGELSVTNSLVATCDFNGFSSGDYIDKLAFQKVSNVSDTFVSLVHFESEGVVFDNPINGEWVGVNPEVQLSLTVTNNHYGLVQGVAKYQDTMITLKGFTDTGVNDLGRQSISVCGYMRGRNVPVSLSGWLDISNNSLQLSRWIANATSPENVYYQSDVESWLLRKSNRKDY